MERNLREQLAALAKQNILIGTSSWKYPGWIGIVYNQKYNGDKDFNEHCLKEYSETFSTVGVDHTYYQWPSQAHFDHYVAETPESFRFGLKVTEKITVFEYPKLKRYGKDAGMRNEDFLNASLFLDRFLGPLEAHRDRLGPIIFEFSQFYPPMGVRGSEFVDKLNAFFTALALKSEYQFGVEIRNANWLQPGYFAMLARHRVAHVFNSWTRMPPLEKQLEAAERYDFPVLISRVLLEPGVAYAAAVEAFSPYDKICIEHAPLRKGAAALIDHAIKRRIPAYVFVNNRAEGCAPKTIEAILSLVSENR